MKKLLCLFAALMLVASLTAAFPVTAVESTISGKCGDDLTWTLDRNGVLTISGTGTMDNRYDTVYTFWTEYTEDILSVVIEDGVTNIGRCAFMDCKNLTDVTIPDSVTAIEYRAFACCSSLTGIDLPDNLQTIGISTFQECTKLTAIEIPGTLKKVENSAFFGCSNLNTLILCDGVETISEDAFYSYSGQNLTSIVIPASVTSIGEDAFATSRNIWHVFYTGTQEQWHSISIAYDNRNLYAATFHYDCTGDELTETYTSAPTCTDSGYARHSCSLCDASKTVWVPALGHRWDAAGCTTPKACRVCGETTGESAGHSYESTVIAPTCTEAGYTVHTCSVCGDSYTDTYVEATGHSYDAVVAEPTYLAGGYTTHTCANCGDSFVDSHTDPLPYLAGDMDINGLVDTDDAIYLLYHTLFGETEYPVNQPCDFDGNGLVDTDDAIYLLYHTLFGDAQYPLN